MRSKVMWSIKNQSTKKLFWAAYNTNDNLCRSCLRDLEGEIESGKSVDVDVPEAKLKLGFWESLPTLGFGGTRFTEPEVVETARSATVTNDKKLVIGPADEFRKKGADAATFLDSHAGRMSDNMIIRTIFMTAAGKIPTVGGAVEFVLGLLWPDEKRSPEALLRESEDRMRRWVQGVIDSYDLRTLADTLAGVRRNLVEYQKAETPKLRERAMDNAVHDFNAVVDRFIKSTYTPGTLTFAIDLATMHLSLLRERAVFTKEIYGDEAGKARFLANLDAQIKEYQNFVGAIAIPGELKWRAEQQQLEELGHSGRTYGYYLKDLVTREVHSFSYTGRSQIKQGPAKVCVDFYQAQARSAYEREMLAQAYDPALLWSRMYPGRENDKPIALDRVVWTGPYAGLSYMVGNEHDMAFGDSERQGPGKLRAVRVRSHDRIDALCFEFDRDGGRWFGNTQGGTEHVVAIPDGVHLQAIETWWNFDLFAIRLHLSNGQQHEFGKHGPGEIRQYASYPDHRVGAVRLSNRMSEMYVAFTPLADYYERLNKA
jgi:hypothetical protein